MMKNEERIQNRIRRMVSLCLFALVLFSCETDSYDKGEGQYSLMLADFAELNVNNQKMGASFVNDEGGRFVLSPAVTASWIQKADTTYRITIYYNKLQDGSAQKVTMTQLPTIKPRDPKDFNRQPQDPLGLESCWVAKSGKYINMGLLLKNGRDESGNEGVHALALVLDETRTNADQTKTACYRLLHDQGTAPQYYTNRRYASILLPENDRPDSVQLTINTFDGVTVKTMKID